MKAMLIKPCTVNCNFKKIKKYFLHKTDNSQGEYDKDVKFRDLSPDE